MANAFLLKPLLLASVTMSGSVPNFDFAGAFAATGALPSGATLARASANATRFNSSGTLITMAADTARFDYDPVTLALRGLLIEPARTNYALRSQEFDNTSGWPIYTAGGNTLTVTANATSAPDGTMTAEKITMSAVAGSYNYISNSGTTAPTGQVAYSVWLKGVAGGEKVYLVNQSGPNATKLCTLTTSWQRFEFPMTITSAGNFGIGTHFGLPGTAATAAQDFYAWGGQIDVTALATSYIATTGATATRAADVLTLNWALVGVPNGTTTIRYTFDDGSTQDVVTTIAGGTATVPTNLNRAWIRRADAIMVASTTPDVGAASNLSNDYAGVIAQVTCGIGANNQAKITLDLGADTAIDTLLVFGVDLFPTTGNLIVNYATAAQGNFTGSFSTDTTGLAYAGSAVMTSGKGVSYWSPAAPVTARYVQIVYEAGAGVTGKSIRASRVVIGKRTALERNFSFGAAFGVKDLGSVDFSRRGVLLRARGAKLRTAGLTFSNVNKDEVEATIKPLLEYLGNTETVALVTDPVVHAQRQNRCYFGPLVGDLSAVWRNARAFESRINLVSLF